MSCLNKEMNAGRHTVVFQERIFPMRIHCLVETLIDSISRNLVRNNLLEERLVNIRVTDRNIRINERINSTQMTALENF